MGLSLALNSARSSLTATSAQIAVASRNTTGANDPFYTRKIANLVATSGGNAVTIQRATDAALFARKLLGTSSAAGSQAVLDGLKALHETVGDTGDVTSPAARLTALDAALQAAANKPDDMELARTAVEAARNLASSLNDAAATVYKVRGQADADIAASVTKVNDLLAQFEQANKAVTIGAGTGADVTDALDDRDRILAALSQEMGVTTVIRPGNDMAIYTDGGVPLFERTARRVSFAPTNAYSAGAVGGPVTVDGVPVTGANSPMPLQTGRIAGLASLRDEVAVRYESQLDGMAAGLIDAFAETGTNAAGATVKAAGLFDSSFGSWVPGGATDWQSGLAAAIRINPAVDPKKNGSLTLLRDGGMNGTGFRANPSAVGAGTAYPDRLQALSAALGATRSFAAGSGLPTSASLKDFATASAGWLEAQRQSASTDADYQSTLLSRASDAYSNAVGVNVDDETAATLQLERSYTASAKLLTVVNDLLKTLMDAVR